MSKRTKSMEELYANLITEKIMKDQERVSDELTKLDPADPRYADLRVKLLDQANKHAAIANNVSNAISAAEKSEINSAQKGFYWSGIIANGIKGVLDILTHFHL